METLAEPFFLTTPQATLFAQYHPPQGRQMRGRVLHLHAFAEELNTCRRLSAQGARSLAQAGYAVLQFDQRGCGDSQGHFENARWDDWLEDAQHALAHLLACTQAAGGATPLWLWGVRSGGLLAAQLALRLDTLTQFQPEAPVHLLLWQPTLSGRQVLQHWLRLHSAQGWLSGSMSAGEGSALASPMQQLEAGQSVHAGGYPIHPTQAAQMVAAQATPPRQRPGKLVWLEAETPSAHTAHPSAAQRARLLEPWHTAGWRTHVQAVSSPGFWQQVGTADAPGWVQASLGAMEQP